MGKIDTNRQSNRQNPRLDNFGSKSHTLTDEDRKKGGGKTSVRKTRANGIKNLKTGEYSDLIPHCHTCTKKRYCDSYDPKDPKAVCKIINIPNLVHLVDAFKFETEENIDDFINKLMQRLYLKNITTEDFRVMKEFLYAVLKVKESKFRTTSDNTVNIQINNFHNEFTIFKDITIKVLKKHPKIMKEWRGAIESAKQSD